MENSDIKYILPVSQYNTSENLNPISKTELTGIQNFQQNSTSLNAATLPDSDKDRDKIKKIMIYSASGIAIIIAVIILVRTFRK